MDVNNILKTTFNNEAELYDAIRPTYPGELFDSLEDVTHISPKDANLLEIGPGTGQATLPLARRGYAITAVELGEEMAKVARRNLEEYKNVHVINDSFEDVELPMESFDLIYAATAFHWIKPEIQYTKPYKLLKKGGYLATIYTGHVSDEVGDRFFHISKPIYDAYKEFRLKSTSDVKNPLKKVSCLTPFLFDENLFEIVFFKVFPMMVTYTAQEYCDLLNTFSPTLSMPEKERKEFLRDIYELIQKEFSGSLQKQYGMALTIGRKLE